MTSILKPNWFKVEAGRARIPNLIGEGGAPGGVRTPDLVLRSLRAGNPKCLIVRCLRVSLFLESALSWDTWATTRTLRAHLSKALDNRKQMRNESKNRLSCPSLDRPSVNIDSKPEGPGTQKMSIRGWETLHCRGRVSRHADRDRCLNRLESYCPRLVMSSDPIVRVLAQDSIFPFPDARF